MWGWNSARLRNSLCMHRNVQASGLNSPQIYSSSRRGPKNFFKDSHLEHLCKLCKEAQHERINRGKPSDGDLYRKKTAAKKAVMKRINELKARKDCQQSEHIDDQFRDRTRNRFQRQRDWTPSGTRLLINGTISTTQTDVMTTCSLANEDFVLDTQITVELPKRLRGLSRDWRRESHVAQTEF